jgi:hypothetical protein
MNTNRTTRIAGFMTAVLMTLAINGAMLWEFDSVAHEAEKASSAQGQIVVKLDPVIVAASRS